MALANHHAAAASASWAPRVMHDCTPGHGILFTIRLAIFAIRQSHTRQYMHGQSGLEETTRGVLQEPSPRVEVLDDSNCLLDERESTYSRSLCVFALDIAIEYWVHSGLAQITWK